MQIALFGDSFCCEKSGYIARLEEHYNAEIVSLGHSASSVYDVLLVQFKKYIDTGKYPDVCIFIWTGSGKLYHRKHRNLNKGSVAETLQRKFHPVWKSAQAYYDYLSDPEKEDVEYRAILHYIDTIILPNVPNTTKIVHLWSFGNINKFEESAFDPNTLTYHRTWQTGAELRPALASISLLDSCLEEMAVASNHLDTNAKNELVFDMIRQAIDTGLSVDRTQELIKYWAEYPLAKKPVTIKTIIKNTLKLFKKDKTDDPFIYI
jgi:hypothetical protein